MDEFVSNIALASLISGIAFIVMGVTMYYPPPKEINYLYGYRSAASMKSQERWDFAQRYCALQAIKVSVVMIAVSLLFYFIPVDTAIKQFSGVFLLILSAAYLLYNTEKAIKKRFQKPK